MLWLCQITFAGVGALTTAQLANNHGWPVLAAVVAGGVVALIMGVIVGFLSIRLGDLYVALVTLTFGLLMENLVFTLAELREPGSRAEPQSAQLRHLRPLVHLLVSGGLRRHRAVHREFPAFDHRARPQRRALERGRRPDVGHQRGADEGDCRRHWPRSSPASGVACSLWRRRRSSPAKFATFAGVVWLAVLVTIGVRSNAAALIAGVAFVMLPALSQAYLPTWTGNVSARALRPRRHLGRQVPRRRARRAEPALPAVAAPPGAGTPCERPVRGRTQWAGDRRRARRCSPKGRGARLVTPAPTDAAIAEGAVDARAPRWWRRPSRSASGG